MKHKDKRQTVGWVAVSLSIAITCIWALWGSIENFHEGWYYESLWSNVGLMFLQYLSPMLIFMGVAVISIRWPRFGSALHFIFAIFLAWFFHAFTNAVVFFLLIPLIWIGALYWYGRPLPRRRAVLLAVGLPLLVVVACGVGPAMRVAQRVDDGILEARLVQGNGVHLVWAPDGPGWPREGADWYEAQEVCRNLSEDGLTLATEPVGIWRLPTVDEAVRSMARHGENIGGVWNAETGKAEYDTTPDKESPLWQVHSQVIYWWTATEVDEDNAYMIVYHGQVWPREKLYGPGYLGFRCVK
jgi:hypothetical protein